MNFAYCFQSERLKKRGSLSSWLVFIGAFFTPAIVTTARLVRHRALAEESASPTYWDRLWSVSWESMAIFLLPLGIVLVTSLLAQIEFKNNAWKQLHTAPQSLTNIFLAKLAVILVMMLQFFALFNLGIYLSGVLPCLMTGTALPAESIPYRFFLMENARYFVDCLPIIGLEFLVSLQAANFLVPVGGGLVMWILSLSVLSWKYGYLFPYAYCGLHYLRTVGKYSQWTPLELYAAAYFAIFLCCGLVPVHYKKTAWVAASGLSNGAELRLNLCGGSR